ncbi:MAG: TatD family hydrolase [Gordonibacter sp.]|uniref:TatD family hydrolase n=1 Tax=Gordonibacter sp. TaxID=1968902 RepID=UPI002FC7717F
MPRIRLAVGCHPHNAKHYDDALEATLRERLADQRVGALGEIGLDFHYDFSPREAQREAFRRQLRVAKECGLPVILHVREAHDEALALLQDEGFPEAGVLLHCYNLDAGTLEPWVEAGCFVAFGGPLTFKKADEVRDAASRVPLDRLLTETDAPYMTPEPMRGINCGPEHVIFTAERLAEVRGCAPGEERAAFLRQLMENARGLLDRKPTSWQFDAARQFYTAAFAAEEAAPEAGPSNNKGASCS